ncbi:MAG TPA: hypothetical protein VL359_20135, partial [bacterium]|nr:hypothetical protein [bacterium]
MKIHLSRIPDTGLTVTLTEPLAGWRRLVEQLGPQPGQINAQVLLKNRRGFVSIEGTMQAQVEVACHRCLVRGLVMVDEPV